MTMKQIEALRDIELGREVSAIETYFDDIEQDDSFDEVLLEDDEWA